MRLPVLVNIAAAAVAIFIGGYAVMSLLSDTSATPCSTRYPAATAFGMRGEKGGAVTGAELQAHAGSNEWGVIENARVLAVEGAPSPLVLEVKLPQDSSSGFQSQAPKGGIGLRWKPLRMQDAAAACLSYHVWFPEEFDFATAGILPGLFGGLAFDPQAKSDGKNAISARVMWRDSGAGEISAQMPSEEAAVSRAIGPGTFMFPRGRWVHLEQEVVLNTPGAGDGVARLWVDGVLRIQDAGLIWRAAEAAKLSGVLMDVSYGGIGSAERAPKTTAIRLAGLEISWR